jgi:hypothetical protein
LILGEETRDGCQAPVLVGLVELGGVDPVTVKLRAQLFKRVLVSSRQGNERGVMIVWTTMLVGVFEGGMTGLHSLLREGKISAGDGVEVGLGVVDLHDRLTGCKLHSVAG